jgi:hypothetical protein
LPCGVRSRHAIRSTAVGFLWLRRRRGKALAPRGMMRLSSRRNQRLDFGRHALRDIGLAAPMWPKPRRMLIRLPKPHAIAEAEVRKLLALTTNPIHRTRFALMYVRCMRTGEAVSLEIPAIALALGGGSLGLQAELHALIQNRSGVIDLLDPAKAKAMPAYPFGDAQRTLRDQPATRHGGLHSRAYGPRSNCNVSARIAFPRPLTRRPGAAARGPSIFLTSPPRQGERLRPLCGFK